MTGNTRIGLALAAGLAAGSAITLGVSGAGAQAPADRAAFEKAVRDYLLAHPEVIPEAMARLEERRTAERIGSDRAALETPFAGAWAGAEKPDVTLVMFTDYACGFCRSSVPDVDRLLAEDKRLKVVWREIPILSPQSAVAARQALAAAQAGKYPDFHRRVFAGGQPTDAKLATAVKAVGLDQTRIVEAAKAPAIQKELEHNLQLAQNLGVSGTPAFVVGNQMLGGAVGYDALKKAVAEARAKS